MPLILLSSDACRNDNADLSGHETREPATMAITSVFARASQSGDRAAAGRETLLPEQHDDKRGNPEDRDQSREYYRW